MILTYIPLLVFWVCISVKERDVDFGRSKRIVWCDLHLHLSLNHRGCWGTTDDFTTSFLHFSLFSTVL